MHTKYVVAVFFVSIYNGAHNTIITRLDVRGRKGVVVCFSNSYCTVCRWESQLSYKVNKQQIIIKYQPSIKSK